MGRKLTSEACYKDRDDDDGTTDYTVLCLQMAVHGIRIRPRLVLICTPLFYPRRFWKIVCFEYVQGCKNDAILPYFMLPEERYGSYQFYSFRNRLESKNVLKCQNGIRKGGTARPGFWFLMGNGSPLPFMAHLPP